MRYQIHYLLADTTVELPSLGAHETISKLITETINTENNRVYGHCKNARETEYEFLKMRNFCMDSSTTVDYPEAKTLILRVEQLTQ